MSDALDARHVRPRSAPIRRDAGRHNNSVHSSGRSPGPRLRRSSSRHIIHEDKVASETKRPLYWTKNQGDTALSIIETLEDRWNLVRDAVARLREDREKTRSAFVHVQRCLEHAQGALREDREFVVDSVKRGKDALIYAIRVLQGERGLKLDTAMLGWSKFSKLNLQLREDYAALIDVVRVHRDAVRNGALRLFKERQFEFQAMSAHHRDRDEIVADEARRAILREQGLVSSALKRDWHACDFIKRRMYADRDFAIEAVHECWQAFVEEQEHIRHDLILVDDSLRCHANRSSRGTWKEGSNNFLSQLPAELKEMREFWVKLVAKIDDIVDKVGPLHGAVSREWEAMAVTEKELTESTDCAMLVMKIDGTALREAPLAVALDPEVALHAVRQNCHVLADVHMNIKLQSWEVVLEAVKQDGRAFQYAAPLTKQDFRRVLQAVQEDGRAFKYAAPKLRDDKEIALAAVAEYPEALPWCSDRLRADADVILKAMQGNGLMFQYAAESMRSNHQLIAQALRTSGLALQWIPEKLKQERNLILLAVKSDWHAVHYIPEKFYDDCEVMAAVCVQHPESISLASKSVRGNKRFYELTGMIFA